MGDVERVAFAEVIGLLRCRTCGGKGWIVTTTGDGSHGTLEQENCPDCETGWAHPTPVDALAALVEAELLPEHWGDPTRAPRWWCAWCDGSGVRWHDADACASSCFCVGGASLAPPSHPALVAVASLGVDALARAEAIVAEEWRGRVVWRVMEAGAIVRHHELTARDGDGHSPVYVFSHEQERARRPQAYGGQPAWPVECPWTATMQSESTWRALRAIARTEAGEPTCLHLLAVDDGRVTLAVEALP